MAAKRLKMTRKFTREHPDLGPLGDMITVRLRRVDRQLAAAFDQAEGGALPGSLAALALISANPGISQNEITTATGIHKSSVVALIDGLEQAKQAVRLVSPTDRRRHALYATPKGESDLVNAVSAISRIERDMLEDLSSGELEVLCGLLDRMNESCRKRGRFGEAIEADKPFATNKGKTRKARS